MSNGNFNGTLSGTAWFQRKSVSPEAWFDKFLVGASDITGASPTTLAALTGASDASTLAQASSTTNLDIAVGSGDASTIVGGAATVTLDSATQASDGSAIISVSASSVLDDVANTGQGVAIVQGTATVVLDDIASTTDSSVILVGNATAVLEALIVLATGKPVVHRRSFSRATRASAALASVILAHKPDVVHLDN